MEESKKDGVRSKKKKETRERKIMQYVVGGGVPHYEMS